jgi:MYXO-CTERM domain-containing protein
MRSTIWMLAAAVVLAAGPASAQDNVAEPVVNATNDTVTMDTNVVTDANLVATTPDMNAMEPAPAPIESELAREAAADERDDDRGIPWGLLGLVGLIGLLGRRRSS